MLDFPDDDDRQDLLAQAVIKNYNRTLFHSARGYSVTHEKKKARSRRHVNINARRTLMHTRGGILLPGRKTFARRFPTKKLERRERTGIRPAIQPIRMYWSKSDANVNVALLRDALNHCALSASGPRRVEFSLCFSTTKIFRHTHIERPEIGRAHV